MVVEGVAMERRRAVVNVQDGKRTKELDNNFSDDAVRLIRMGRLSLVYR